MVDESRQISITVQATQAQRALGRIGNGLESMNNLAGASSKALSRAEKQLQRYGAGVTDAARVITTLKNNEADLNAALREANKQLARQKRSLENARGAISGSTSVIKTMRKEMAGQAKTIDQQAEKIAKLKRALADYNATAKKSSDISPVSKKTMREVQDFVKTLPGLSRTQGGASFGIGGPTKAQREGLANYKATLGLTTAATLGNTHATTDNAAANKKNAAALEEMTGQNVALRYALYSTAATFGVVAAAGVKAFGDILQTGIDFNKNIAGVLRTSQVETPATFIDNGSPLVADRIVTASTNAKVATDELTKSFLDLQATIPVSSQDLTTIGTLAAQMGISAGDITDFTRVVAEFAATTGVGVDEAATGLARLGQLSGDNTGAPKYWSSLASAILKTGVNSLATEQQILKASSNIASISNVAHLSSAQIVALASAMSSLGITSELQRSTVTTSFSKILAATSQGEDAAAKFGAVMNLTGRQFIDAWGKDAYGTFTKLTAAIASSSNSVGILQDLGLASQRLTPTLLKVGQNYSVFQDALKDSSTGQKENNELQRQFSIIAQTTAAKIQVLSQAWDRFLVTIGSGPVSLIGNAADALTGLIKGLGDIASTPAGQVISVIVIGIGLLGTGLTAVVAAAALAGAAFLGLEYVVEQLGLKAGVSGLSIGAMGFAIEGTTAKTLLATAAGYAWRTALLALVNPLNAVAAAAGVAYAAVANDSSVDKIIRDMNGLSSSTKTLQSELTNLKGGLAFGGKAPSFADLPKNFAGLGFGKELSAQEVGFNRGMGSWAGNGWESIRLLDEEMAKFSDKEAPNVSKQLAVLKKKWVESGQGASSFSAAFPDTISKLSLVAGGTAKTTDQLTAYYDGLADTADQQQNLNDMLDAQNALLGVNSNAFDTAQAAHDSYVQAFASGASGFFNISDLLDTAYGKGKGKGGGIKQLQGDLDDQISSFKKWRDGIQKLTAEGSTALADAFIAAGPSSQSAVTDSLKLDSKSRARLNQSMREAAFFASKEYAESFSSQNAILADIYHKTLQVDPKAAQQALRDGIKRLGNDDSLSQTDIDAIQDKYGITLDVRLSDIDPTDAANAKRNAQAALNSKPLVVPTLLSPGKGKEGPTVQSTAKEYPVTEGGNTIVLNVKPDTKKGKETLNAWRANEYQIPVKFKANVDTTEATRKLLELRALANGLTSSTIHVVTSAGHGKTIQKAKGGGIGIPGYANGGSPFGQFRGPGTGTSDSILARVSNGEYINTAAAVRHYGADFFDALNRRQIPRYASGGGVGSQGGGSAGATLNVNVTQNYPTTVDPLRKLKADAENLVAGIWS